MSKVIDNEQTILTLQARLNQRGHSLILDGHAGARTRAALNIVLPDLHPAVAPPAPAPAPGAVTNSRRHYDVARQYLGIKEKPGSGTHPQIALMFALAPSWLDQDDSKTAWCGIFRGWIGQRCGTGLPPEHYRAAAWAKWGRAVDVSKPATWQQGDTIVMTRPGGNHVCLLDRVAGQFAWVLGGNQSNSVNITRFPLSRVTHVRR